MIVVVAAMKGGVGKTTTAVYLAALAVAGRRDVALVDADPQASAADWLDNAPDTGIEAIELVEAPTERLLGKALERVDPDGGRDRRHAAGPRAAARRALELADVVIVPTRAGGVETPRVEAVLDMVPARTPAGLVMCSARTFTRDYQEMMTGWREANVQVWGTVPERVAIAAGPDGWLSFDGLEAYRGSGAASCGRTGRS